MKRIIYTDEQGNCGVTIPAQRFIIEAFFILNEEIVTGIYEKIKSETLNTVKKSKEFKGFLDFSYKNAENNSPKGKAVVSDNFEENILLDFSKRYIEEAIVGVINIDLITSEYTNEYIKIIEGIALKVVPFKIIGKNEDGTPIYGDQLPWRIVNTSDIPKSRNWRNAWTGENNTETVDIDLEKAKVLHKELMASKAKERIEKDLMGEQDFTKVKKEIEAIDLSKIKTLDELYNTFPKSIDKRPEKRKYKMYG